MCNNKMEEIFKFDFFYCQLILGIIGKLVYELQFKCQGKILSIKKFDMFYLRLVKNIYF